MPERHALIVVDLAFGDCGKGTVVDFLTRRHGANLVVRFNGGPQAAHNVVTADGRHHTFSQFGSGSFVPGVRTLLSRFMLIEPYALFNEAAHLRQVGVRDPLGRLLMDERCPIITPAHQAANRLREFARGDRAHGTCGMGVGETMQDLLDAPDAMLYARDLADGPTVARKLRGIVDRKVAGLRDVLPAVGAVPQAKPALETLLDPAWIDVAAENYAELARQSTVISADRAAEVLRGEDAVIFEGAQGVLLDEWYGFHPHTTWSTTTFANAQTLLDESDFQGRRERIGVLRTYFTRHGAGPMVTHDADLRPRLPEPHNHDAGWQGRFRVGPFDAVAARYALTVAGGVDSLAITHMDRLDDLPGQVCTTYEGGRTGEESLGEFFVHSAGRIADLRFNPDHDLMRQERFTAEVSNCRAVFSPLPEYGTDGFLSMIQRELRHPVGLLSFGPTASDKRVAAL